MTTKLKPSAGDRDATTFGDRDDGFHTVDVRLTVHISARTLNFQHAGARR